MLDLDAFLADAETDALLAFLDELLLGGYGDRQGMSAADLCHSLTIALGERGWKTEWAHNPRWRDEPTQSSATHANVVWVGPSDRGPANRAFRVEHDEYPHALAEAAIRALVGNGSVSLDALASL